MSRIMTRRRVSPPTKPEESLTKTSTVKKKVTKSKQNSLEESKNNNSNVNTNKRNSKRLVKRSNTSTKSDMSNKENEFKATETTKKFFKHINPKADVERTYAKSTLVAGLRKPQPKPRAKKNFKVTNKLRQLSLKESLSNQEQTKKLRPRQDQKDYCEDSNLIEKHLTPNKKQSIVLVERLNIEDKKKLPVYKSIKSPDDSVKNETDIYDFKFEDSDPKGKLVKKKKRRIVKRQGTKKQIKKGSKGKPREKFPDDNEKVHEHNTKVTDEAVVANINDDAENFAPLDIKNNNKEVKSEIDIQMKGDVPIEMQDMPNNQVKKNKTKPKIISVTDLEYTKITLVTAPDTNNENITSQPQKTVGNKTLQYKNMINDTLLNKSLSPIKKTTVTFDPSSPWRAPTVHTFSQVKNLYQSTPRLNAANILSQRITKSKSNARSEQQQAKTRIIDKINENSYVQPAGSEENFSKKNSLASPRKFGTEITNVNQFNTNSVLQSNKSNVLPSTTNNFHADNTLSKRNKLSESVVTSNVQSSDVSNDFRLPSVPTFNDNFEDKENTAPNFQSPKKKSPKKKVVIAPSPPRKENLSNTVFDKENTIYDPQPGPSGLQTQTFLDEQKSLKQSNLNSFLNLTEMPESTRISTKHGIFDDAHSTPITSKVSKKIDKDEPDVENAFGFSDDSDLDISPIQINESSSDLNKPQLKEKMKESADMPAPVRLPTGQIKNNLFPGKIKEKENKVKKLQLTVENIKEREDISEQKKSAIDAISFSDTFDMLSETGELPKDLPDPPLFVDLEPSHFTQPPRHSYKRKRNVRFSFSDDENETELDEEVVHRLEHKKRKVGKLGKEEEKRLEEWVKSVNQTFEEIDHHDLVVE